MSDISIYMDLTVYSIDGKMAAFLAIYAGEESGLAAIPCGLINVKFNPVVGKRFTESPYITINPYRIQHPPICGNNPKWPGKRVYLPRPNGRLDVRPIVVCARNCGLKCVGLECQALEPVSYGAPNMFIGNVCPWISYDPFIRADVSFTYHEIDITSYREQNMTVVFMTQLHPSLECGTQYSTSPWPMPKNRTDFDDALRMEWQKGYEACWRSNQSALM